MADDVVTREALAQGWVNFLQELTMARAYPAVNQVAGSVVGKNELLETLLPSQFYIRLASLADEALAVFLELHALTCTHLNAKGRPEHEKPTFANRTRCLEAHGSLKATTGAALDCLRQRRNVLAHAPQPRQASWAEVDGAVGDVEQCLMELQLVCKKLRYTAEAFQDEVRGSDDPAVAFQQDYGLLLKRDGEPIREIRWTIRWSK